MFQILTGLQQGFHVDALLSNLLKDRGIPRDFSFPRLFPGVAVTKLSDLIGKIDVANELQLFDGSVGYDGLAEQVSVNVAAPLRYQLQEFGFEAVIRNLAKQATDDIFDYAARQGQYPYDRMRMRIEYACVNQTARLASNFPTSNETLSTLRKWSNYGSLDSNPINDLLTWCTFTREESGRDIAGIFMSYPVWRTMQLHPTTLARMDTTGVRILTKKILAEILEVPEDVIFISRNGIYNAAKRGQPKSLKYFWGSDVFVCAAEEPSRNEYGFGHLFYFGGAGDDPIMAFRYPKYEVLMGGEVVQVASLIHPLVEVPEAAYLAKSVVDTTLSIYGGKLD